METFLVSTILILANYLFITFAFKRFGLIGLYICVPITITLANLQVVVTIDAFGLAVTLGNVAYASSYLITDLLGELYGHKYARTAVGIGFFTLIMMTLIMNIVLLYTPLEASKVYYESLANIFTIMPRITLASLCSYYISQNIDVWIYKNIKHKNSKYIWIRNNISTVTSQAVDTLLFTIIAFTGVFPLEILIEIFITTYIIKAIVAVLDTPFIYLGVKLYNSNNITEIISIDRDGENDAL